MGGGLLLLLLLLHIRKLGILFCFVLLPFRGACPHGMTSHIGCAADNGGPYDRSAYHSSS
ncbi:MAG TPA: hypothetical protein VFQ32_13655 [Ktedonobacterales bacterium]|nr:hypothetical protein [Ktedonobacterales bacterium]